MPPGPNPDDVVARWRVESAEADAPLPRLAHLNRPILPAMTEYLARTAYHELLDLMRDVDATFVEGDRAVTDEVTAAEGYRFLTDALHAALEIYLRSDARRPAFVPIVGPTFKWGGDNSDAFYNFAPIAPDVEYRVHGKRGDAVYLSVCIYGGPDDGRWSTRIVSNLNDRDIDFDADGSFEIVVSRERPADARNWLALADDANAMVTRDYHVDPVHGAPTLYDIEAIPAQAPPPPLSDAEVAGAVALGHELLTRAAGDHPAPRSGHAEHHRRRLGRARRHLRVGGEGRALRDGVVRTRRRRTARDHRSLTRLRVLGLHALERRSCRPSTIATSASA